MGRRILVLALTLLAFAATVDGQGRIRLRFKRAIIAACANPIACNAHPRLFITSDQIPGIRNNINTYYSGPTGEFQKLINYVGNTALLPSNERPSAHNYILEWGGWNAMFLCLMDPAVMTGYSWPANIDTKAELGDVAMTYVETGLDLMNAGTRYDISQHGYMNQSGTGAPFFLTMAATFDWGKGGGCLDEAEEQQFIDAFKNYWTLAASTVLGGYDANLTNPSWPISRDMGNGLTFINLNTQYSEQMIAYMAFLNDSRLSDEWNTKFRKTALQAWAVMEQEMDDLFYDGFWHFEGGGYSHDLAHDPLWLVMGGQTAMGVDWIRDKPMWSNYVEYMAGNAKLGGAIPYGVVPKISAGIMATEATGHQPDNTYLLGNVYAAHGMTTQAAQMKYIYNVWEATRKTQSGFDVIVNNIWCCSVRARFFGDWSGVAQSDPHNDTSLRAVTMGYGQRVFRSGLQEDSSRVYFGAQFLGGNGHGSECVGCWGIDKDGTILLNQVHYGKNGAAALVKDLSTPSLQDFFSGLNIRNPLTENGFLGVSSATWRHADGALALTRTSTPDFKIPPLGYPIRGEHIDGTLNFGWVSYDYTPFYRTAESTGSSTDFFYLRGPENHEWVIRHDRFRMANLSTDKAYYGLKVPVEPEWNNGDVTTTNPLVAVYNPENGGTETVTSTNAATDIITHTPHGGVPRDVYRVGETVMFSGHSGTVPDLNGTVYTVESIPAVNQIKLVGLDITTGTAVSSGTVTKYHDRVGTMKTSTNATQWTIRNQLPGEKTWGNDARQGPTDALGYFTMVHAPSSYTARQCGGPYLEPSFESCVAYRPLALDGTNHFSSEGYAEFYGRYRLTIEASGAETQIGMAVQIAKASTVGARESVIAVSSADTLWSGYHVRDTTREWLVAVPRLYANYFAKGGAFTMTIVPVSGTIRVLVANIPGNTNWGVSYASGVMTVAASGGTTIASTSQNMLTFTINVSSGVITSGVGG